MKLTIIGELADNPVAQQWAEALRPMIVRHPNRSSEVELELMCGEPLPLRLKFVIHGCLDTTDPNLVMTAPFHVATSQVHYFPGAQLARAWVAAAWAGYMMHEALELTTVGDMKTCVIDPHGTEPGCNDFFWRGIPNVLTPTTLRTALELVVPPATIERLIAECR